MQKQLDLIKRGVVEVISENELKAKLKSALSKKKPLRIKAGFDPSAPDIHLGHTVLLRKLRHFQELGHKVVFLIGDCTAMIGDPSGQSETRKPLTPKEVEKNATTYVKQVSKILDTKDKKVFELRFNSEWFGTPGKNIFGLDSIIELTSKYTVARLLERDDFLKRYKAGKPISVVEFLYPLMQGYDSVKLNADIEIGGTDQKFNLLVGRDLQGTYGQAPQVVLTLPLLEGTDGVKKMSKSLNNHIGIDEKPDVMFGKVMSVSDEMMFKFYELLTDVPLDEVKAMQSKIKSEQLHPKKVKMDLAANIIEQYHSRQKAKTAKEEFDRVFKDKKLPTKIPVFAVPKEKLQDGKIRLAQLLVLAHLASSNSDAKRLIKQGAVTIDNKKSYDINHCVAVSKEIVIKAGKLKHAKIIQK